jgi:hypothetical protein
VVSDADSHGVLYLGGGLAVAGMVLVAWLHFTARRA